MRNPKTWPPRSVDGAYAVELGEEKRTKMKRFAHEYIKKLVLRKQTRHADGDESLDMSVPDGMDMSFADTTVDVSPGDTTADMSLDTMTDAVLERAPPS